MGAPRPSRKGRSRRRPALYRILTRWPKTCRTTAGDTDANPAAPTATNPARSGQRPARCPLSRL